MGQELCSVLGAEPGARGWGEKRTQIHAGYSREQPADHSGLAFRHATGKMSVLVTRVTVVLVAPRSTSMVMVVLVTRVTVAPRSTSMVASHPWLPLEAFSFVSALADI